MCVWLNEGWKTKIDIIRGQTITHICCLVKFACAVIAVEIKKQFFFCRLFSFFHFFCCCCCLYWVFLFVLTLLISVSGRFILHSIVQMRMCTFSILFNRLLCCGMSSESAIIVCRKSMTDIDSHLHSLLNFMLQNDKRRQQNKENESIWFL